MTDVKHMDIEEFHELGFLQEANRNYFHPLGLALEVGPPWTREDLEKHLRDKGVLDNSDDEHEHVPAMLDFAMQVLESLGLTTWHLGGVWDYRDDDEGVVFGPGMIDRDKMLNVRMERQRHRPTRESMFGGSILQPVQTGA